MFFYSKIKFEIIEVERKYCQWSEWIRDFKDFLRRSATLVLWVGENLGAPGPPNFRSDNKKNDGCMLSDCLSSHTYIQDGSFGATYMCLTDSHGAKKILKILSKKNLI